MMYQAEMAKASILISASYPGFAEQLVFTLERVSQNGAAVEMIDDVTVGSLSSNYINMMKFHHQFS